MGACITVFMCTSQLASYSYVYYTRDSMGSLLLMFHMQSYGYIAAYNQCIVSIFL